MNRKDYLTSLTEFGVSAHNSFMRHIMAGDYKFPSGSLQSRGLTSFGGTPSGLNNYLESLTTIISYESVHKMPLALTMRMLSRMPAHAVLERARIIGRKWASITI